MNKDILNPIIIVTSIVLIISVLLQVRSNGSFSFGGAVATGESFRSRRGAEKLMYYITILSGIILVVSLLVYAVFIK